SGPPASRCAGSARTLVGNQAVERDRESKPGAGSLDRVANRAEMSLGWRPMSGAALVARRSLRTPSRSGMIRRSLLVGLAAFCSWPARASCQQPSLIAVSNELGHTITLIDAKSLKV